MPAHGHTTEPRSYPEQTEQGQEATRAEPTKEVLNQRCQQHRMHHDARMHATAQTKITVAVDGLVARRPRCAIAGMLCTESGVMAMAQLTPLGIPNRRFRRSGPSPACLCTTALKNPATAAASG